MDGLEWKVPEDEAQIRAELALQALQDRMRATAV
jgi:hypothetical protein